MNAGAAREESAAVLAALRGGAPASAALVNRYYGLCIPFYREFLGDHWHTGFYEAHGPIGPQDQLRMERLVADSAGIGPASEVLDVGCGVGGPTCHLARATGARMRGLTPNAAQLAIAHANAQREGVAARVGFDLGEAGALPYADESFDAVLFFESPCHFPDRGAFLAEAWRVLRPGGRLAGEDWLASESCAPALRERWSARICATWAIPALGTLGDYAGAMARAGFQVQLARDLREEMALLRGFMADEDGRAALQRELRASGDALRRYIMEGVLVLGEAAECGAFTVGRFLARKPARA